MQCPESEILKLHPDAIHTQAHRNGCVDLKGFERNTPHFFTLEHPEGSHIVQSIGELDQNHPKVFGHGQGHFLKVFGLLKFDTVELYVGSLLTPSTSSATGSPN